MADLQEFGENLWIVDDPDVCDMGILFTTRMVLVKLRDGFASLRHRCGHQSWSCQLIEAQFTTRKLYPSGEPILPSQEKSPFSLDSYLS